MVKYKATYSKDKETKWLNQMADEGWAMTGFFAGFYKFEKCEPKKWRYEIDFCEKSGYVSNDYREFMSEAGIEIVQCWGRWVFLRKNASEGDFKLYTDVESALNHYQQMQKQLMIVALIDIFALLINIYSVFNGNIFGLPCIFLISAFTTLILSAMFSNKNTIDELKSRQTGSKAHQNLGPVSPVLAVGLLFNSAVLVVNNSNSVSEPIEIALQIIAIILILTGIFKTVVLQRNRDN